MLDRFDQSELLALIEGELDARALAALQRRLAGDPQAAAMIEAMIRDRATLRTTPEPLLPHDFLRDIEPMLTRPMLIEPLEEIAMRPDEFRRKHRRRRFTFHPLRLAAAAAVLMLLVGGSWALIALVLRTSGESTEDLLAMNPSPTVGRPAPSRSVPAPDVNSRAAGVSSSDDLGPGTVHHFRPPLTADAEHASAISAMNASTTGATPTALEQDPSSLTAPGAAPAVVAAEFVVVVQSKDAAAAESAVSGAVAGMGQRVALVRNFSYQEAQNLAEEYRVAHGGSMRGGDPPMRAQAPGTGEVSEAALSGASLQQLAQHVREQLKVRAASGTPAEASAMGGNATIAGSAALAPTLEQQLDFSSRGATYTLAVPASELNAVIQDLALRENGSTMLRMLPTQANAALAGTQPLLVWLTEGPYVRQAMDRLSQARGDTLVLVPVMVK